MLLLATLLQIAIGLAVPAWLAQRAHERLAAPYWPWTVGAAAGLVAQIAAALARGLFGGQLTLALAPAFIAAGDVSPLTPIVEGVNALLAGFISAGALAAAYVYLARGVRSFPPVVMIALGFGGVQVALRALLAALDLLANLRLQSSASLMPDEAAALSAYFARSPLEPLLDAFVGLLLLLLGITVALLVGRMFLTGEVGYFFFAVLWASSATVAVAFFAPGGTFFAALAWAVVGMLSAAIVRRVWRFSGG